MPEAICGCVFLTAVFDTVLSYTVGVPCHPCNWRGGWVHRPVVLWSISLSDVSVVYAWFPNSSSVILFCMLSGVVKFHFLVRIRVCSVGYAWRKQIVGDWFWYSGCALCTWCLCLYRFVLHTSYYTCYISSCKYHSGLFFKVTSSYKFSLFWVVWQHACEITEIRFNPDYIQNLFSIVSIIEI